MRLPSKTIRIRILLAAMVLPVSTGLAAQEQQQTGSDPSIIVNGVATAAPATVPGPEIKGVISARDGDRIKVTTADGASTVVAVTEATKIKSGSGLFSAKREALTADALLNGLPVTIKTLQPADGAGSGVLMASQVTFRRTDFKTANMIRHATDQRFAEQAAATEALRGRVGDIDKYNIKNTINVHFDTGKAELSAQDKANLCATATSAEATENALLLVVGYTDSVGDEEYNQQLSEKRAARVINYLQQACGWKPYRMLTPTGMAEADPLASNDTEEGKAQNRRVAVNVLVSKSVDGL